MGITLLLVRHGQTVYNAEGRYQGQRDIPLSSHGRWQAQRLGERLAAAYRQTTAAPAGTGHSQPLPGPPVTAYASDLGRAAETAALIADTLTRRTDGSSAAALPVISLPLLRERSFGAWEGLSIQEIKERFPEHQEPEGGETWPEVWTRMDAAFHTIWQQHTSRPEPSVILVVGHGGSLRAFLCRALGVGHSHVRRFRLDNASLSIAEFWGGDPDTVEGRVALLNDTAHLHSISGESG